MADEQNITPDTQAQQASSLFSALGEWLRGTWTAIQEQAAPAPVEHAASPQPDGRPLIDLGPLYSSESASLIQTLPDFGSSTLNADMIQTLPDNHTQVNNDTLIRNLVQNSSPVSLEQTSPENTLDTSFITGKQVDILIQQGVLNGIEQQFVAIRDRATGVHNLVEMEGNTLSLAGLEGKEVTVKSQSREVPEITLTHTEGVANLQLENYGNGFKIEHSPTQTAETQTASVPPVPVPDATQPGVAERPYPIHTAVELPGGVDATMVESPSSRIKRMHLDMAGNQMVLSMIDDSGKTINQIPVKENAKGEAILDLRNMDDYVGFSIDKSVDYADKKVHTVNSEHLHLNLIGQSIKTMADARFKNFANPENVVTVHDDALAEKDLQDQTLHTQMVENKKAYNRELANSNALSEAVDSVGRSKENLANANYELQEKLAALGIGDIGRSLAQHNGYTIATADNSTTPPAPVTGGQGVTLTQSADRS